MPSIRVSLGIFASKTQQRHRQSQTCPPTPLPGTDTSAPASTPQTLHNHGWGPSTPLPASTRLPFRVHPTHVRPTTSMPTHSGIPTHPPITTDPAPVPLSGLNTRLDPIAQTMGDKEQPPGRGSRGWGARAPPFTLVAGRGSAAVSWMPRPQRPWQQPQLATSPISACN